MAMNGNTLLQFLIKKYEAVDVTEFFWYTNIAKGKIVMQMALVSGA